MTESTTLTPLDRLAAADPGVAPLVRLQTEALRCSDDAAWDGGIPALDPGCLGQGMPMLHGVVLTVDLDRVRDLLHRLAGALATSGSNDAGSALKAIEAGRIEPLEPLQASVVLDHARLQRLADGADVEGSTLAVLGQLAAVPVLRACGRRSASVLDGRSWERGFCPVCAAWPILAEIRGLDRQRFLCCGRCGTSWRFQHHRCIFCGNGDHQMLSYFAAEKEREMRRVETCDRCQGYLKVLSVLGAQELPGVLASDLSTLELDAVVLEHGYARPEQPGFNLDTRLEAATEPVVSQA